MKILGIGVLFLALVAGLGIWGWRTFLMGKSITAHGTAHAFSFQSIDGTPLSLKSYEGKAILLVNTASKCGFTPQYEGLEKLWETYADQGLVVLGVPSNDFGEQEPGNAAQIKEFCTAKYDVQFPLTAKVSTKGEDVHPFYAWVRAETGGGPKWNFHKYLIAPDGQLVGSFPSAVKPMSNDVIQAVQAILPKG